MRLRDKILFGGLTLFFAAQVIAAPTYYVQEPRFLHESSSRALLIGGTGGGSGGVGPQGPQGIQGERGFRGYSGAQGLAGADGVAGATGPIGPSNASFQNHSTQTTTAHGGIHNLPAGGTTGQKLVKTSDTDYATGWSADTDAYVPLTGGTMTGRLVNSAAGAASTPAVHITGAPYTAGSATTAKALVLIEPTGITAGTTWATAGTLLGINGPASGLIYDFKRSGITVNSLSNDATYTLTTPTGSVAVYYNSLFAGGSNQIRLMTSATGSVISYIYNYGPSLAGTIAGANKAGLTTFHTTGADSSGLQLATLTDKPILFSPNSAEVVRVDKTGVAVIATDTVVSGVSNILSLNHDITGTPAIGAGTGINFLIDTTSTASQQAANIAAVWTDATTATRTSKLSFSTVNSGTTGVAMELLGDGTPKFPSLSVYADNTAALAGGLTAGMLYRTSTGVLMVTY